MFHDFALDSRQRFLRGEPEPVCFPLQVARARARFGRPFASERDSDYVYTPAARFVLDWDKYRSAK